jgi:hypothetical protein
VGGTGGPEAEEEADGTLDDKEPLDEAEEQEEVGRAERGVTGVESARSPSCVGVWR